MTLAQRHPHLVLVATGLTQPEFRFKGNSKVATANSRYLEFFYFDAGGGHRSAANALRQVIAERLPLWQVELVNLQQLLQTVDPLFRLTKVPSQNVYNGLLRRGWTYGSLTLLRGLQTGIRIFAPQMKLTLQEHWQHRRPDLVVSLIPNFNSVMFEALRSVYSYVPYVTIMTDLIDFPPHFWLENQEQFVICGTGRAVRQAHSWAIERTSYNFNEASMTRGYGANVFDLCIHRDLV